MILMTTLTLLQLVLPSLHTAYFLYCLLLLIVCVLYDPLSTPPLPVFSTTHLSLSHCLCSPRLRPNSPLPVFSTTHCLLPPILVFTIHCLLSNCLCFSTTRCSLLLCVLHGPFLSLYASSYPIHACHLPSCLQWLPVPLIPPRLLLSTLLLSRLSSRLSIPSHLLPPFPISPVSCLPFVSPCTPTPALS